MIKADGSAVRVANSSWLLALSEEKSKSDLAFLWALLLLFSRVVSSFASLNSGCAYKRIQLKQQRSSRPMITTTTGIMIWCTVRLLLLLLLFATEPAEAPDDDSETPLLAPSVEATAVVVKLVADVSLLSVQVEVVGECVGE
ncbi:hypothetical protein JOM56_003246 [Amanita muscaria]